MAVTVRCHACDNRLLCPDEAAGKKAKCRRCGAVLRVPLPAASVPDWQSAPPPVRRAAADAPPQPVEPDLPEADGAAFSDLEDYDYAPPEPWYYGFLEKYALTFMWIGIVLESLWFAGLSLFLLLLGTGVLGLVPGAGSALLAFVLFLAWLFAAAVFALSLVVIIAGASYTLLAVDAARNIRVGAGR